MASPMLHLRNPRSGKAHRSRNRKRVYRAKRKHSATKRKSKNEGLLTLMKLATTNPRRRRTGKKYKAKNKRRSYFGGHKHRNRGKSKNRARSRRRRNTAAVAPVSRRRSVRRYRARSRSRNPYGAPYATLLKDGGVALINAVITRAGPATLSSALGFANSGMMGYLANLGFAAAGSWAAEKFLGAGYPAAIGGVVAIADRVVDDFTGTELLDVKRFQELREMGVSPAQAAAQATSVTASNPQGTAGMGRFDRKWSLISGGYQRVASPSFPPATAYPAGAAARRPAAVATMPQRRLAGPMGAAGRGSRGGM